MPKFFALHPDPLKKSDSLILTKLEKTTIIWWTISTFSLCIFWVFSETSEAPCISQKSIAPGSGKKRDSLILTKNEKNRRSHGGRFQHFHCAFLTFLKNFRKPLRFQNKLCTRFWPKKVNLHLCQNLEKTTIIWWTFSTFSLCIFEFFQNLQKAFAFSK